MSTLNETSHRPVHLERLLSEAPSLSRALTWWIGEESVRIHVYGARDRPIKDFESDSLLAEVNVTGHERTGVLRARSGPDIASTSLLVLPDRIPRQVRLLTGIPHAEDPRKECIPDIPLGVAMECLGNRFRRRRNKVRLITTHAGTPFETVALVCSAVLTIDSRPIGLTSELVLPDVSREIRSATAVDEYLAAVGV